MVLYVDDSKKSHSAFFWGSGVFSRYAVFGVSRFSSSAIMEEIVCFFLRRLKKKKSEYFEQMVAKITKLVFGIFSTADGR